MPKAIIYVGLVLVILAMIPPAIIARTRAVPSEKRRIHLIQDMDNQSKFRAQQVNPIFADNRAMRPPVHGTVARGELNLDAHYVHGVINQQQGQPQWATAFPSQIKVDMDFMKRGQERFNIYCLPCHGESGDGDGMVHKRAMELVLSGTNGTTWVQPKSLHEQAIAEQPVGQIFNTITNGIRTMPSYESQIPLDDRWAIVAYVEALQRSQNAKTQDIPAADLEGLRIIELQQTQEPAEESTQ
jgi:mono/diheme cytochrome c family protein